LIKLWSLSHTPFHTLLVQLPMQRWGSHTLSSAVSQNTGFPSSLSSAVHSTRLPHPVVSCQPEHGVPHSLSSAVHSTRLYHTLSSAVSQNTGFPTPCHQLSARIRGYPLPVISCQPEHGVPHSLSSAFSQNAGFPSSLSSAVSQNTGFPTPCHQLSARTRVPHSLSSAVKHEASLQRQNAENLKQIFPEKEYRGLSPNFHIHVSVSELYVPTIGLPFLLEEICGPILGIYKWLTDT
jgi:hypothetical protein